MRFFAIALGRRQCITTRYREYKKLIAGVSDPKVLITDSYEKAEKFIKDYNMSLKKLPPSQYESNIMHKSSFINKGSLKASSEHIIWLTAYSVNSSMREIFDADFQAFVTKIRPTSAVSSLTVRTPLELKMREDTIVNYRFPTKVYNTYYDLDKLLKTAVQEENKLLLITLNKVLKTLEKSGAKDAYVVTDSHYISNLLIKDVTKLYSYPTLELKYSEEIFELYTTLNNFDKIYVSRYTAMDMGLDHSVILKVNKERSKQFLEVWNV